MPHLILYDGDCGLCSRLVLFVLKSDHVERFIFAPLQGMTATRVLEKYGMATTDLDTVILIANFETPNETLYLKSRAVLEILRGLGGVWRSAQLFRVFPRRILDFVYDLIATRRRTFFGTSASCPPAPEKYRDRFLP